MTANRNRLLAAPLFLTACAFFIILAVAGCSEDGKNDSGKTASVEERYPGLSRGMLKNAKIAQLKADVLAETGGVQITAAQLDSMIAEMPPAIQAQAKKNLVFLLEQRLILTVLLQEAKAAGVLTEGSTDDNNIQALVMHVAKGATVSDEDIKSFYEANKAMVGEASFDAVKEIIRSMLLQQKQQEVVNAYFTGLEQRVQITANRDWMEEHSRLARDNSADKARFSGKPSVVEFDVAASRTRETTAPLFEKLGKKHSEGLNVVFVNVEEEQVLGARYGIEEVPTQIFFDRSGKEISRHTGLFSEEELAERVAKIGVN